VVELEGLNLGQANEAAPGAAGWGKTRAGTIVAFARAHALLLAVLAAFALAAIVVPTLTPTSTTDDWTYARSAQILLSRGGLTVFPVVVATAIFPIAWGAFFGFLFGPQLGIFRLSTVVITALGALALYGLCRELGVSRPRSALGVATYLFNPLVFMLTFTFMTDPHFVALLAIASWLLTKSIGPDRIDNCSLVLGSGVVGLAFLTRQQGALITVAFLTYLLVGRRLSFDWKSTRLVARAVAIPVAVMAGYYLWLHSGGNVAAMQTSFLQEVEERGRADTWWLLRWLTVFGLMYLGFFTLPLMAAALPRFRLLLAGMSRRGQLVFAVWASIIGIGVAVLTAHRSFMPYLPQFFGASGLGAPDVLGGRPAVLSTGARFALTVVCLFATLLLGLVLARSTAAPTSADHSRAGFLLGAGLWQALGVLPASYHFVGWSAGSLDRYLEPLAPIGIALALWALNDFSLAVPAGWIVVMGLALFSIAGTRDYLVFMGGVWSFAEHALAVGVPIDRLDAGAGWDGYYLYEAGLANHLQARTKDGPWWVHLNAPATDSAYVVASRPISGYDVVEARPYSSWLLGGYRNLYLERRQGETWPPCTIAPVAGPYELGPTGCP